MDARLAALERAALQTGAIPDVAALLRERARVGTLPMNTLRLAALCGDPAASATCGLVPATTLEAWLRQVKNVGGWALSLRALAYCANDRLGAYVPDGLDLFSPTECLVELHGCQRGLELRLGLREPELPAPEFLDWPLEEWIDSCYQGTHWHVGNARLYLIAYLRLFELLDRPNPSRLDTAREALEALGDPAQLLAAAQRALRPDLGLPTAPPRGSGPGSAPG